MKFPPTLEKESFERLSNKEKRIAIAKDVIARVDAGMLRPKRDTVISGYFLDTADMAKQWLAENSCSACAKGALICSWIGNFNSYEGKKYSPRVFGTNSWEEGANIPQELIEIFGAETLDQIEVAFEGQINYYNFGFDDFKANHGMEGAYPVRIESPYFDNYRKIFQEIIDNDGDFVFNYLELEPKKD
jgi:hypothetical protein